MLSRPSLSELYFITICNLLKMGCSPGTSSVLASSADQNIQMKAPPRMQNLPTLAGIEYDIDKRLIKVYSALIHKYAISNVSYDKLVDQPPKEFRGIAEFIVRLAEKHFWSFFIEFIGYDTTESVVTWLYQATQLISVLVRQSSNGTLFGFSMVGTSLMISRRRYRFCAEPEYLTKLLKVNGLRGFVDFYFSSNVRQQMAQLRRYIPESNCIVISSVNQLDLLFYACVVFPALLTDLPASGALFASVFLSDDMRSFSARVVYAKNASEDAVAEEAEYSFFYLNLISLAIYCETSGRLSVFITRKNQYYMISEANQLEFNVFKQEIVKQLEEQQQPLCRQLLNVIEGYSIVDEAFVQKIVNYCMHDFLVHDKTDRMPAVYCYLDKLNAHLPLINRILADKTSGGCHCSVVENGYQLFIDGN